MEAVHNIKNIQNTSELLLIQGTDKKKLLIPNHSVYHQQQQNGSQDLTNIISRLCSKYNDIITSDKDQEIYKVLTNALNDVDDLIDNDKNHKKDIRSEISVNCQTCTTIEMEIKVPSRSKVNTPDINRKVYDRFEQN